jgi:predicted DNA-binding transcriptional regulator YafY
MIDEIDEQGRRRYTVREIADMFGVSRPAVYRDRERARAARRPTRDRRRRRLHAGWESKLALVEFPRPQTSAEANRRPGKMELPGFDGEW